jgi:hypothetical protein
MPVVDDEDRDLGHVLGPGAGSRESPAEVGEHLAAWTARSPAPTRLPSASSGSWPATNTNRLPVATATWLYVGGVGRSSGLMSSSVIDGLVSPTEPLVPLRHGRDAAVNPIEDALQAAADVLEGSGLLEPLQKLLVDPA